MSSTEVYLSGNGAAVPKKLMNIIMAKAKTDVNF